jgi:hypothetical protein
MRRPAQHRLGPTAATGWAHPYTGLCAGLAVFYNDGGQGGAPRPCPPRPTSPPADQQPAAPRRPPHRPPDDQQSSSTRRPGSP